MESRTETLHHIMNNYVEVETGLEVYTVWWLGTGSLSLVVALIW